MTPRTLTAGIVCLAAMALALLGSESPRAESGTHKKNGYALTDDRCGTFPKLRIAMRSGYCAGLVAAGEDGVLRRDGSRADGIGFPRSIVQVPDTRFFVVADMVGWGRQGRLLLLDPEAADGKRLKEIMTGLNHPHGLAVGIDRRIYASTIDSIFRFDPLAADPAATREDIVRGLPGLEVTLSDGTKTNNEHPLKHFVFDRTGRLYLNVGAPSDVCTKQPTANICAAGEGPRPFAALWVFTPPPGGIFPALRGAAAGPAHEVYARGLRNSMALAMHPQFPDPGFAFLQGENARDLPDAFKPNEEINVLERGKHYGWPYCYDLATASPEYAAFLSRDTPYRDLCRNAALYKPPYSLLSPHGAPLAMFYYAGDKFAELKGKLVVGLHGYRPAGSRVLVYDVDAHGFPKMSPAPVRYGVNCGPEPTRVYATDSEPQVAAAQATDLISGWYSVKGVRPRGAPVGMTVAADGAIWLVEDRNKTIIRIDTAPASTPEAPLSCGARSTAQIDALAALVAKSVPNQKRLRQVRTALAEPHCYKCHSDFGVKAGMTDAEKDGAALRYILAQDGWVFPGDSSAGRLHSRIRGKGSEKIMPPDDGAELLKDADYRRLLTVVDELVDTMVPGTRKRVIGGRGGSANLAGRTQKSCGAIPDKTIVVVLDANPKEKPGFSRIYRPADQYFDKECDDRDGYYVSTASLRSL